MKTGKNKKPVVEYKVLAEQMLEQARRIAEGEAVGMEGHANWMYVHEENWFDNFYGSDTIEGRHQRVVALCLGAAVLKSKSI